MKSTRLLLASLLAFAAPGLSLATPAQAPRRTRPIQVHTWQPAVDTGASSRATQRRATRGQRRHAFQNAVAIHGSARQARRVRAAMTHGGT